uniref:Uncharacterized protein n=1 Tax=Mastacembelus armatus TaxID=205130 RepID=A0A7N8WKI0_9TELE
MKCLSLSSPQMCFSVPSDCAVHTFLSFSLYPALTPTPNTSVSSSLISTTVPTDSVLQCAHSLTAMPSCSCFPYVTCFRYYCTYMKCSGKYSASQPNGCNTR